MLDIQSGHILGVQAEIHRQEHLIPGCDLESRQAVSRECSFAQSGQRCRNVQLFHEAVGKSQAANLLQAFRQANGTQIVAVFKRRLADGFHSFRQCQCQKPVLAYKSIPANGGDAFFNDKLLNAFRSPGRGGASLVRILLCGNGGCGIIPHVTGAGDGQSAVCQRPGQVVAAGAGGIQRLRLRIRLHGCFILGDVRLGILRKRFRFRRGIRRCLRRQFGRFRGGLSCLGGFRCFRDLRNGRFHCRGFGGLCDDGIRRGGQNQLRREQQRQTEREQSFLHP